MPVNYQFIWGYSALNYYFAVLIFAVGREGFMNGFLENGAIKYIGRISYGLYVYHNGLIWFAAKLPDLGLEASSMKLLSALLALLFSFVLAALTYKYIEMPLLNLKDRYFAVR